MADDGVARARRLAGESIFTPELGAAICARVRAGESVKAICRDPEMPARTTVWSWARSDELFAGELRAAMDEVRLARRRRDLDKAAVQAVWTARKDPARGGRPSLYSRDLAEHICQRLTEGESLIAITRDPAMPGYGTVYNWLNRHTEFADLYAQAREVQAHYFFDEAREVSLDATPKTVWVGRLRFDTIRWMTARMAPKKYCERLVIDAEISARRAQEAQARGEGEAMTVIVKRFCDITPEEQAAADETERLERLGRWG
jgi:hypothetical protein